MCLQLEEHAERVSDDQQDRQADAELLCKEPGRAIRVADCGGNQKRERGQEQQAGLHPRADPVEFLLVVFQPAQQKRHTEHEQRVADDRAR